MILLQKTEVLKNRRRCLLKSYEKPLADMIVNVNHIALTENL